MLSPQTLLSLLNLPGYGKKTVMSTLEFLSSDLNTPKELAEFTKTISGLIKRAKEHTEDTAVEAFHSAQRIRDMQCSIIPINMVPLHRYDLTSSHGCLNGNRNDLPKDRMRAGKMQG